MLVLDLLYWWYSRGFLELFARLKERLKDAEDFFSIRLLIKNLFSPFRQISAQGTNSLALSERFKAFIDLLISRIVGATVRFLLLIVGIIVIIAQTLIGLVMIVVWPALPLSVVGGVILCFAGVVF